MKFTIEEFLEKLPLPANEKWKNGVFDIEPFKKANVTLVFFAPREADYQTFHDEDEFYFIARGSGELVIESERFDWQTGDAFFVPAKKKHRFENFTDDFATWAIFSENSEISQIKHGRNYSLLTINYSLFKQKLNS